MRWRLSRTVLRSVAISIAATVCSVLPARAGLLCTTDDDCSNLNPCTTAVCTRGICLHQPSDEATCDDGNACTANDRCANGNCVGDAIPGCGVTPTDTATQTESPTATPTPTMAAPPTATATPPVALECDGDFDLDHRVTVDEILTTVTNALNGCPPECDGDFSGDGSVTVDEILTAVTHALDGCPKPYVCTIDDLCGSDTTCLAPSSCQGFPTQSQKIRLCDGSCSGPVRAECVCANRARCGAEEVACGQQCEVAAGDTQSRCNAQCAVRDAACGACRSELTALQAQCDGVRQMVEAGTLPMSALTECRAQITAKETECETTCSAATACPTGCQSEVQTGLTACLRSCQLATDTCLGEGCCP